jgi:GMP synthase-like glutamine amidotransferase
MRIGILQTGRSPEVLRSTHGDYNDMIVRFLDGEGFAFETYPVLDQVFPESAQACDGWLITGSKFCTYEDHPWIPPLQELIREIFAAGVPLTGICFGHQIIAQALGGKVERCAGGWSIGAEQYEMKGFAEAIRVLAWHQDQVTELPDDARVLASSQSCKYAALAYGGTVFTIQPHPEFNAEFMADLLDARRDVLPDLVADKGLASLATQVDSDLIADKIKALFKSEKLQ